MSDLIIRNGFVYDPLNGLEGEKADISISNGKIVESVGAAATVIDAAGMIVMPGGVDIHSHIAGSKVNAGRILRPEDHVKDVESHTAITRAGTGHSIPSTFTTGYRYAKLGYTTVFEPASPLMKTRHTHEELDDTPIVDKGCFPLFGNDWHSMEYLQQGRVEECAAYIAWMLRATKGYAIKLVNPGGVEAWKWGRYLVGLEDRVPNFDITPREIVRGICKANQLLNLPHTIHVHTNDLAKIGNYQTTIDTIDSVRGIGGDNKPVIHITHVQFTGRTGSAWHNVGSGAPEIADYVNKHGHVTVDMGQVVFMDTTTMTADGGFQYMLYQLSGKKWANFDVEVETGTGIVPYRYRRNNYVNAIQWGIGLELALLIKDPWRVYLTTDNPNGGTFTKYPKIISWLMSRKARDRSYKKINSVAKNKLDLPDLDREYSFSDIAIVTRAGTAKALGLKQKGHLGVGADADVAVYDLNPTKIDPSRDYLLVRKALKKAAFTIKDGRVVVKKGEILETPMGRTYWVDSSVSEGLKSKVESDLRKTFTEYYSIQMDNYAMDDSELANSSRISVKAKV
jgi:formylmethanofuran dehydrogenase subunit A